MNDNKFFHLINDIDYGFIEEADDARAERVYLAQKHSRLKQGLGIAAGAAASVAILSAAVYFSNADFRTPPDGVAAQLAPGTIITGDGYKWFIDEHGNSVKLKGEPMEPDKLWSFGTVQPYDVRIDEDGLNDFFINEGIPDEIRQAFLLASDFTTHRAFANVGYADSNESTDAFMQRLYGTYLTDPENRIIYVPNFMPGFDTELIVSRNGKHTRYRETGISYDSFFEALCSAYTEESAAQMIEKGDMYYEYGGELWCAEFASRGSSSFTSINIIDREYKLITYTDTEFEFSVVNTRPFTGYVYNPNATIEIQTVKYRLVKTDNGWRSVWSPTPEFTALPDYTK